MSNTKTFILWSIEGFPVCKENTDQPIEYKSQAAALKAAKKRVRDTGEEEIWVYHLTHVVARPDGEPSVEKMP